MPSNDTSLARIIPSPNLARLVATGPTLVMFTSERELPNANPNKPSFLKGVAYDPEYPQEWIQGVLEYIATLTFVIASSADIDYAGQIFSSSSLPHIFEAVTKLELPGFYWFSGVASNRCHNPYLLLAKQLPNLLELSLTMHAAGITTMRYSDYQIVTTEASAIARSRELGVMSLTKVLEKYDMEALFECLSLRTLRIIYVDSQIVSFFTTSGSPDHLLWELQAKLAQGFDARDQQVVVELLRDDEQAIAS